MNLLYSLFPLLGINLWQFSVKVSVQLYNVTLVYPIVCYIYDQDVTIVARYINQKGCYYIRFNCLSSTKNIVTNGWVAFWNKYMIMREKMRRKELTEHDIPYDVMLLVLVVACNQMSRVSEVDMSSLYLHCH